MNLKLTGKTAFVSGSTAGIGLAIAKTLLKEGAHVIINGRSEQSVENTINTLKTEFLNSEILGVAIDFAKAKDLDEAFKILPTIDILINNVGIYKSGSFFEMDDADWYEQFEVNVMSGVRLSRKLLPPMLEKNWGRIIFISSECALLVPADMLAYSMTKTAMLSVSRGLSHLTKGSGVTVNAVLPGSTLSEGAERFLEDEAKKSGKTVEEITTAFFTEVRSSSLLQRFASVEEVANTVTYLASPLSTATNGAAIKMEGGSTGGII